MLSEIISLKRSGYGIGDRIVLREVLCLES